MRFRQENKGQGILKTKEHKNKKLGALKTKEHKNRDRVF